MSTVLGETSLAEIGVALGDAGQARMLAALLGGRVLSAGELAYAARVGTSTASGHLARLVDAGILVVLRQGRHRYFRLASPAVAAVIEQRMTAAAIAVPPRVRRSSCSDAALQRARLCYDHTAGRLGVAIAACLMLPPYLDDAAEFGELSVDGEARLRALGLELAPLAGQRRAFCRPCLDWSERRFHLAGALGAGIAERLIALHWLVRQLASRALTITDEGARGLEAVLGIDTAMLEAPPAAETGR